MYYNETIILRFFWSGVTNTSPSSIIRSIFLLCKIEIVSYGSQPRPQGFPLISERGIFMDVWRSCRPNKFRLASLYRFSHVLTFCHIEIALCRRFHRMRCWSLSLIRHIWSCLVLLPSLTVKPYCKYLLATSSPASSRFPIWRWLLYWKTRRPWGRGWSFWGMEFFFSYGSHVSCSFFL